MWEFPGGSAVKNLLSGKGDMSLIPGSGRPPRGGNGNTLQYSCLENPMDGGGYNSWGCKESDMTKRLNLNFLLYLGLL